MYSRNGNQVRSVGARIGLELDLQLIHKGYEDQLKVHIIPKLLLKLRLVNQNATILDHPDLRFREVET